MFNTKNKKHTKNMIRIVRVYKDKWNFFPFEIERKYK